MAAQLTTTLDLGGNDIVANSVSVGATTNGLTPPTGANLITIYAGTGAPTFSAGQGDLYLRTDGSSTSTRMYINTTGSTTWTNVTTAA